MPIHRMVSSPEPLPAASGMLLQPSRAATVCEVDRARKRAASCNRLGPRIPKQHWEFDTCPNEYALDPKLPNLRVLRHVLHLSSTEVPSLHQSYPVSAVLRTSPPPHSARPVPHGRPVGPVISDLTTLWGFPCCARFPCVRAAASTPVQRLGVVFAHLTQPYQPSPKLQSGRSAHRPFRGLLGVHSRCGPHTRAVPYM